MPKVTGVFGEFENFDRIPIEDIARWLSPIPNTLALYNFYANRIYYPQTVAISGEELKFDLAILTELLARDNKKFINKNNKKIIIPEHFLARFPDVFGLVSAFINGYLYGLPEPFGVWNVTEKGEKAEDRLASVVIPKFDNINGLFNFSLNNKKLKVQAGKFINVGCSQDKCKLIYQLSNGTLLGRNEGIVDVYGGLGGVFIDGRKYGAK